MAEVTYPCYWQKKNSNGQWYWIYYAQNGEAIARSSESYVNRSDCEHSIKLMKEMENVKIQFPIFMLTTEGFEPFTIRFEAGDAWPLFDVKETAGGFAIESGRADDLLIQEIVTATDLLRVMNGIRPGRAKWVWLGEAVPASNEIAFRDRPPIGEFLSALKAQADAEQKADLN